MQAGSHTSLGRSLIVILGVILFAACSGSGNATDGGQESGTSEVAETGHVEAAHPIRISQGQPVQLADYAAEGQHVVFDFMSDYCPPCRQLDPWMSRLHNENAEVTVVKVDINRPGLKQIDWGSPVAAQFRLSSIPHFKVMDEKGNLVAEGDQAWQMIVGWLQQLPAAGQSQGR